MNSNKDALFVKYIDNMACYYNIGIIYKIINSDLKLKANPRLKDLLFKYEEYKDNNNNYNYIKINGYYRELKGEYYLDLKRILCSLFNPNDNGDKKKDSFLEQLSNTIGSFFLTTQQIKERTQIITNIGEGYLNLLKEINTPGEIFANNKDLKNAEQIIMYEFKKKRFFGN
tara:strand:+ start:67 stop:579 length:513 start_codon:yes stop_codon:yes gene_type:complete